MKGPTTPPATPPSPEAALAILQHLLDEQTAGIMTGDFTQSAETMALPYRRAFLNHETVIETRADLEHDFAAYATLFRGLGVNQFIALASDAEWLGAEHIAGHYVCHALCNGIPMLDSFAGRAVLRQTEGGWRMAEMQTMVTVYEFPFRVVQVPFDNPAPGSAPENDARREAMAALPIYERHLEALTRTVEADAFDAFCDLHEFPHSAHGATLDQVIESPDDLRPFYETLRRCQDGTAGDRIERSAERADFIGPDLICGYHTGRVFKGDVKIVDDVQSRMILKRRGATWRLQTAADSTSNTVFPFSMYEPGGRLRTHLEIQKRTRT